MCEDVVEVRCDRGFVLILVIWLTALLALLAVGFAAAVQSNLRLTSSAIQSAKAEAAADSGIQLAVLSLVSGAAPAARRFAFDGTKVACAIDDQSWLAIKVQDSGGRISLNLANERLLQALFLGLGATLDAASRATDSIIDYRDADSDRRPNGAEKPEYDAAGRPLGPKNGPFDTIEELNQVLGLEPEMVAKMTPFVTVHSQTAGIDPRAATNELAELLARGVQQLPARSGPGALATDPGALPAEFVIGSPQRVLFVTSESHLKSGAAFVRETVVELQSTRDGVPAVKMWKRGVLPYTGGAHENGDLPPC